MVADVCFGFCAGLGAPPSAASLGLAPSCDIGMCPRM